MSDDDELLDLVDEHDVVIGSQWRSETDKSRSQNFRVVNGFVVNPEGLLWIPRRAPTKRLFPNCLDFSIGGHVASAEGYEKAFERELLEELNIRLNQVSYRLLGHLNPFEHDLSAFMQVYEIVATDAPNYNVQDFTEYFWLRPAEALTWIEHGEPEKADLAKLIRMFYVA